MTFPGFDPIRRGVQPPIKPAQQVISKDLFEAANSTVQIAFAIAEKCIRPHNSTKYFSFARNAAKYLAEVGQVNLCTHLLDKVRSASQEKTEPWEGDPASPIVGSIAGYYSSVGEHVRADSTFSMHLVGRQSDCLNFESQSMSFQPTLIERSTQDSSYFLSYLDLCRALGKSGNNPLFVTQMINLFKGPLLGHVDTLPDDFSSPSGMLRTDLQALLSLISHNGHPGLALDLIENLHARGIRALTYLTADALTAVIVKSIQSHDLATENMAVEFLYTHKELANRIMNSEAIVEISNAYLNAARHDEVARYALMVLDGEQAYITHYTTTANDLRQNFADVVEMLGGQDEQMLTDDVTRERLKGNSEYSSLKDRLADLLRLDYIARRLREDQSGADEIADRLNLKETTDPKALIKIASLLYEHGGLWSECKQEARIYLDRALVALQHQDAERGVDPESTIRDALHCPPLFVHDFEHAISLAAENLPSDAQIALFCDVLDALSSDKTKKAAAQKLLSLCPHHVVLRAEKPQEYFYDQIMQNIMISECAARVGDSERAALVIEDTERLLGGPVARNCLDTNALTEKYVELCAVASCIDKPILFKRLFTRTNELLVTMQSSFLASEEKTDRQSERAYSFALNTLFLGCELFVSAGYKPIGKSDAGYLFPRS